MSYFQTRFCNLAISLGGRMSYFQTRCHKFQHRAVLQNQYTLLFATNFFSGVRVLLMSGKIRCCMIENLV